MDPIFFFVFVLQKSLNQIFFYYYFLFGPLE